MTPNPGFVADLAGYDPLLRCRWSEHRARLGEPLWIIERKAEGPGLARPTFRDLDTLKPTTRKDARTLDLWAGFAQGFQHVMDVHVSLLEWSRVAPVLAAADAWKVGNAADRIEAQDEAADRQQERHEQNIITDHIDGAYDQVCWEQKRRISTYVPDGGGFVVNDKRAVSA